MGKSIFCGGFLCPLDADKLKNLQYTSKAVDFSDADDCLFIVFVRDSYDWLKSFYTLPHHLDKSIRKGFFRFISSKWKVFTEYEELDGQYNEIDNLNPWTNHPFSIVLELRKYKNINYLELSSRVNNYLLFKYEDIRDYAEEFIEYVAKTFDLENTKDFSSIDRVHSYRKIRKK